MGPVGKYASEGPKSERAPRGSVPFAGFVRARAALSQTLGRIGMCTQSQFFVQRRGKR